MILLEVLDDPTCGYRRFLRCPKSEPLRQQIKARPGWEWSPQCRMWNVPIDVLPELLRVVQAAGLAKVVRSDTTIAPPPSTIAPPPLPLRAYQSHGVAWAVAQLAAEGAALLADEMGLGKTPQAICVAANMPLKAPLTIVCPAAVRSHWRVSLQQWAPDLEASVWSYEGLRDALDPPKGRKKAPAIPPVCGPVIVDEVQFLKNPKARRTRVISEFLQASRRQGHWALALTGTPMTKVVADLWPVLELLWPGRFGSFWQFGQRYCGAKQVQIERTERLVWDFKGKSNEAELSKRLQHFMLRRTKAKVASDMPALQRIMRDVPMPQAAARDYQHALRTLNWEGSGGAAIGSLLSAVEDHKVSAAIELASEVIESGGRPLLITSRKATARLLAERLSSGCVTGDTPTGDRVAMLAVGDAGVATRGSVGTGVDGLQHHFDVMIVVGLWYIPSDLLQNEARLHRIGQAKPVTIYYLIGEHTIDEKIRSAVIERLETFNDVVGGGDESQFVRDLRGGSDEDLLASLVAFAKGLDK